MLTLQILDHIKKHGQIFDAEIATTLGLKLASVRTSISELATRGQITCCDVTRFKDGKPVKVILCRASGYIPPVSPGRKPNR